MYRVLQYAFALCGALVLAHPALSQAPRSANWDGYYLGLNAGYASGDARATDNRASNGFCWNVCGDTFIARPHGVLGGAQAGYNWQLQGSSLVVGIEGDIGWLGASGRRASSLSASTVVTTRGGWYATLRPRAGVVIGNALVFATGGLIAADTNSSVDDNIGVTVNTARTGAQLGWTIGGGAEWMLTPNWTLKADVLWYDLGSNKVGGVCCGGGVTQYFTIKQSGTMARVGVNWRP